MPSGKQVPCTVRVSVFVIPPIERQQLVSLPLYLARSPIARKTSQTGATESRATREPLMGQVIKFVADFAIDDSSIEITLVHKRRALENESKEEKMQGKRLIIASTNCKKKLKSIEVIMIAQLVPQNGVDTVKQKIPERQENANSEFKALRLTRSMRDF